MLLSPYHIFRLNEMKCGPPSPTRRCLSKAFYFASCKPDVTDGRTDGQTDRRSAECNAPPSGTGRAALHVVIQSKKYDMDLVTLI